MVPAPDVDRDGSERVAGTGRARGLQEIALRHRSDGRRAAPVAEDRARVGRHGPVAPSTLVIVIVVPETLVTRPPTEGRTISMFVASI